MCWGLNRNIQNFSQEHLTKFSQEIFTRNLLCNLNPLMIMGCKSKSFSLLIILILAASSLIVVAVPNVKADPYMFMGAGSEIPAPPDAIPPIVMIISPENDTVKASGNITLAVAVNFNQSSYSLTDIYYRAGWQSPNTDVVLLKDALTPDGVSYDFRTGICSVNTGLKDGFYWLIAYAKVEGIANSKTSISPPVEYVFTTFYYVTGYSQVSFTVDSTPPIVQVVSLENKSFSTSNVVLDFKANETLAKSMYSLDGQNNVTISGNSTLSNLPNGLHNITVYVWDVAGNVGVSETASFKVEAFPYITVTAILAVIVVSVSVTLVYFKKRKH
jgi:hypothetical protein